MLHNLFQYVVLILFMAFNSKSQDLMYQTFQKKVLVLLQVLQNLFQINTIIHVIFHIEVRARQNVTKPVPKCSLVSFYGIQLKISGSDVPKFPKICFSIITGITD